MREDGKKLRRLGLAAGFGFGFALATTGALAQLNEMSLGQRNLACGSPAALDDGWTTASPESVGLDGARLCGIAARLKEMEADVHSVVIVRHGKLVFEQYFPGYDEPWGQDGGQHTFDATIKHDMRSASKSVVSLLVGIAIDRGLIASVDEPVVKFYPEHADVQSAGWDQITLRHLLTMSSGMQWDENRGWTDPKNDEPHLGSEADPIRYVLSKPVAKPPDALWTYNGGSTDLLGNILERVSGNPLEAFAREVLFQPLGINDVEWMNYPKNAKVASAAGLRIRPRDAAKIGQLVLDQGAWRGKQIVSADWIAQSVRPRFQAIGYFSGLFFYGQQWWLGRSISEGTEVKWIAAMGSGGQRIFIVPDRDLVVMTTSGLYFRPHQGDGALDMLTNVILPSARDKN
ncbi:MULTISPECIES: serine hydrolase domain-containing protein [Bradyrhizobium]|uniref:CubicO group peptidase, beta-lactamase class C family n=2 Tax=Bradyrhizobium TaxID=374 RepID=A0ABY0PI21_9BRAD|nr:MULTISPECIES: serine hydrolase [Bradyrhizobium]SDI43617.1 CubicO group peptidase, beta-lactamase class C family [Bradyrhizobium ottawaense]SED53287.1 CubicO group peptidase, beta-lactamase class C family [Bradyrhizobium lablabi]